MIMIPTPTSPEPVVVTQPQFTRVKEPTLLCNQLESPPCVTVRPRVDGQDAAVAIRKTAFSFHLVSN